LGKEEISTALDVEELEAVIDKLLYFTEPLCTISRPNGNLGSLVTSAYQLTRTKGAQEIIQCYNKKYAKQVWSNILFLSRLQSAFNVFCDVKENLIRSRSVNIILIEQTAPTRQTPALLDLNKALELVCLPAVSTSTDLKRYFKKIGSVKVLERIFLSKQKDNKKRRVHAEIQLISYLAQNPVHTEMIYPYIGCSKRSCYLCEHFITIYGTWRTRGGHGKLYPRWSLPDLTVMDRAVSISFDVALERLQHHLEKQFTVVPIHTQAIPESSVGLTEMISTARFEYTLKSPYIIQFVQNYRRKDSYSRRSNMFTQDTQNTSTVLDYDHDSGSAVPDATSEGLVQNPLTTRPNEVQSECCQCERPTSRKCLQCDRDWYCSLLCQGNMRARHKMNCAIERPLNTADYLYLACDDNVFPDDKAVLEDFGFNAFPSMDDRQKLLGLYIGLTHEKLFNISSDTLHKWQSNGNLIDSISNCYKTLEIDKRGAYFLWFLQNLDLFSNLERPTSSGKQRREAFGREYLDACRTYMTPKEQRYLEDVGSIDSDAIRHCVIFYTVIVNGNHPPPTTPMWLDFGFCACKYEWTESRLGVLYQKLTIGENEMGKQRATTRSCEGISLRQSLCSFTEFHKAYETGGVYQLFLSKGFLQEFIILNLAGFESVMSRPIHKKADLNIVWYLYQFLSCEDSDPSVEDVYIQYGFFRCKTFQDKQDLKEIYRKARDMSFDPLDLDHACKKGEVYQYLSTILDVPQKFERLMGGQAS